MGGNNFWGVQVFSQGGKEYVAVSDMAYGLYIFEYPGAPNDIAWGTARPSAVAQAL